MVMHLAETVLSESGEHILCVYTLHFIPFHLLFIRARAHLKPSQIGMPVRLLRVSFLFFSLFLLSIKLLFFLSRQEPIEFVTSSKDFIIWDVKRVFI